MIPYVIAVLACCLAGGMGGFVLARPHDALARRGLTAVETIPGGPAMARSFGGMLLAAHAGTAGLLGYYPTVGASMALALALLWAGAAVGRLASGLFDGASDANGVQTLLVEVMMSLTLALPFWTSRQLTGGPMLSV